MNQPLHSLTLCYIFHVLRKDAEFNTVHKFIKEIDRNSYGQSENKD